VSTEREATPPQSQRKRARRQKTVLLPSTAPNEGVRLLRELRLRMTYEQIARKVGCDETAVATWAEAKYRPRPSGCNRMFEAFGIPLDAWDRAPEGDAAIEAAAVTIASSQAPLEDFGGSRAAATALAAAIEAMTTGHPRILATALRRMLEGAR
jgi:transcriptional regulator with XRE-family HTH domain